jgi:transcriptional regulator with XRE-family HTH domain
MKKNTDDFGFAKNLRQARLNNKQLQAKLAELLFVSQDTISLWERNKSCPDLKTFCEICKIYSISADELLGLDKI